MHTVLANDVGILVLAVNVYFIQTSPLDVNCFDISMQNLNICIPSLCEIFADDSLSLKSFGYYEGIQAQVF